MSRNLFLSTVRPDGFQRGRRLESELPTTDEDTVGDAIFTPAPVAEVEDKWSRLATAIETVESHPLVKEYGFSPDSLITAVDSDQPVAMGFEVLAMTLAACRAADELSDLAGPLEVCKVLGWKAPAPTALKGFGADRLFRSAGALQARIQQIKAECRRPAPPQTLTLPSRSAQPRKTLQPPTSRTAAPAAKVQPITPALLARIEAGKKAAIRLESPGATQKLNEALATKHSKERAERLVAEAEQMLRTCEATPAPRAQPAARPAPQQAKSRPIVGHNGKTERNRLKKLVRAGKMTVEEYILKTGYSL